jgi:signal peptidase I
MPPVMARPVLAGSVLAGGVLAALAAAAGILRRRLAIVTVVGESMQPTLVSGDRVLVRRVASTQIRPGQVIVIERPHPAAVAVRPAARQWMIKRVAAVPGDTRPDAFLPASRPAAFIPSAAGRPATRGGPRAPVVPPGKFVVLGDNPARSHDSRQLGYFAAESLLGIVLGRLPAQGRS